MPRLKTGSRPRTRSRQARRQVTLPTGKLTECAQSPRRKQCKRLASIAFKREDRARWHLPVNKERRHGPGNRIAGEGRTGEQAIKLWRDCAHRGSMTDSEPRAALSQGQNPEQPQSVRSSSVWRMMSRMLSLPSGPTPGSRPQSMGT